MDAARVVCYHAADCTVVAACRIRRQEFVPLFKLLVKHGLDNAGLDHYVVVFNFDYPVHVLCKIKEYAIRERLPEEPGSGAPCSYRHLFCKAILTGFLHYMLVYGVHDRRRLNFVVACIHRIDLPAPAVAKNLSFCNMEQVVGYTHWRKMITRI